MSGFLFGVLYLVSIAFLITLVFTFLFKRTGPWGSFWTFFVIVLLGIMAADFWVGPVGPYFLSEIYWVPPLAVGLLIALLLAATTPSPKTRSELELQQKEIAKENKATAALGTFFWFLFIALVVLIVIGLFNNIY